MSLHNTVVSRPSFRQLVRWPLLSKLLLALLSVALFLGGWALLNVMFNLRYPARLEEPKGWYLLPSMDATAILGILALLAWARREVRKWALIGLVAFVIWVRIYRVADGLIQQNYFRGLQLSLDVPMIPELVRLMYSTVPLPKLLLWVLLLLLAIGILGLALYGVLWHAQRFLGGPVPQRALFIVLVVGFVGFADKWPAQSHGTLHKGLFGMTIVPEFTQQVHMAATANKARFVKSTEIAGVQRRLQHMPSGLEHLRRADVLFFLIESYGITAFANGEYYSRLGPTFQSFADTLGRQGYHIATGTLDSSTYGGGSWLAHATLASGVRIADGRDFAVLRQGDPKLTTMATMFQRNGYRSVVVQPGTTRRFPEGEVRGFQGKYYLMDLGYKGPPFAWATMPDQYVLDFIHRREVAPAKQPVFVQYALVSSHAPWSALPAIVEDWSDIGDGDIYNRLPPTRFPIDWSTMFRGGDAYVESLLYDLEVIKRYVGQVINRPSLIIVMGDHQPAVLATPASSRSVPVHMISQDKALIDRFTQVGYAPGMIPPPGGPVPGMETFLVTLIERLSAGETFGGGCEPNCPPPTPRAAAR